MSEAALSIHEIGAALTFEGERMLQPVRVVAVREILAVMAAA